MQLRKIIFLLALPISGWALGDTVLLQTVEIIESSKQSAPALHARPLLSMDQALEQISGTELLSRGPLGGDLWSRGLGEQRLEVRLDGLPLHGACTDRMDPATIYAEPSQLSQIELKRGALAASGGLGQSLNLVPVQADFSDSGESWSSQYLALGSRWPEWGRSLQLAHQYHGTETAWVLNLNYKGAENLKQPGSLTLPYSSYDKGGASLSTQILTWDHWIWENHIQYDREGYVGYPALPMDVGRAQAWLFSTGLQKNSYRFRIFHNQVTHSMDDTHREFVPMHMDMPGWSKVQGLKAEGVWGTDLWDLPWEYELIDLWKKANMTMYMPGQSNMVLETWPSSQNFSHQIGLSAQRCLDSASKHHLSLDSKFTLSQAQILSALGRAQWGIFQAPTSAQDWGVQWGASLHSDWNELFYSSVDLAWIRRIPSLEERWGFYLYKAGENRDRLGNPWLGPEQIWQSQAEIKAKGKIVFQWNPWLRYYPKASYLHSVDSIAPMSPGAAGVLQEQWGHSALHWGQELEIYPRDPHFRPKFSLQSQWIRDGQGRSPLYYSPLQFKLALDYTVAKLKLWTQIHWDPALGTARTDLGEKEHLSWTRTDLGLNLPSPWGNWSVEINNLWDSWIQRPMDWGVAQSGRSLQLSWAWNP